MSGSFCNLCLALPEAHEKEAWGDPTFRVKDKIFAMHKIGDGRQSLWCKADPYERDAPIRACSEAQAKISVISAFGTLRMSSPKLCTPSWKYSFMIVKYRSRSCREFSGSSGRITY